MKKTILVFALLCLGPALGVSAHQDGSVEEFSGVVTFHLIPAKVIRVNRIVEDPAPGTSYIGDESILVEVEADLELLANWTVVDVKYFRYDRPKTIEYEVLSEPNEITVEYHAVDVVISGDLSQYIDD